MIGLSVTWARNIRIAEHDPSQKMIKVEIECRDWAGNAYNAMIFVHELPPQVIDKLMSAFADEDTIVPDLIRGAA